MHFKIKNHKMVLTTEHVYQLNSLVKSPPKVSNEKGTHYFAGYFLVLVGCNTIDCDTSSSEQIECVSADGKTEKPLEIWYVKR